MDQKFRQGRVGVICLYPEMSEASNDSPEAKELGLSINLLTLALHRSTQVLTLWVSPCGLSTKLSLSFLTVW